MNLLSIPWQNCGEFWDPRYPGSQGLPHSSTLHFKEGIKRPCLKKKYVKLPFKNGLWWHCVTVSRKACRHFRSDQSLSRVRLSASPWIAARQASLSITNSQSSLRLTSIESVMPSSHLILCRPLLLLPPIPASIRVFSNESTFRMRWPKYWSFSFSAIPSKEHPRPIFFFFFLILFYF